MMAASQKCQYALRAVFQLAMEQGDAPVGIRRVATAQAIPQRFLEQILGQLRQAGVVRSVRGRRGGYVLKAHPERLTVGEIIRFFDGPVAPVRCISTPTADRCPLHEGCALMGMWTRARDAVSQVYDTTTFQDLIDQQHAHTREFTPNYCI